MRKNELNKKKRAVLHFLLSLLHFAYKFTNISYSGNIMRATFAEIYINNFVHNLSEIKRFMKSGVKMCVAVKADGYGHGAVEMATAAQNFGAEYLAVATVEEGIELRKAGIKTGIVVLSLCNPCEAPYLFEYNLEPFAGDEDYIDMLQKSGGQISNKLKVHLAVDTGMGRIGCRPENAATLAKKICASAALTLGGMSTHFASADGTDAKSRSYARLQFERFTKAVESVKSAGIDPGIRHCSASAALIDMKEWQLDMVRPGIIAYGYYPDQITRAYLEQKETPMDLKPVMALVTGVSAIRPFEQGESVSYGMTWTSEGETDIAVLPIGYADGFLRRFNRNEVTINGKLYPIRGRICMDQCMVDIGKNNPDVKRWDKVVIFGPEESGALCDAEAFAQSAGTISYEVLTSITKRVARKYIR